jgi:hypothetical protein
MVPASAPLGALLPCLTRKLDASVDRVKRLSSNIRVPCENTHRKRTARDYLIAFLRKCARDAPGDLEKRRFRREIARHGPKTLDFLIVWVVFCAKTQGFCAFCVRIYKVYKVVCHESYNLERRAVKVAGL